MNEISIIKSHPHGLTLILNPDVDFESLARNVCSKFAASRDFFGKEFLVLSIEGRTLTDDETEAIIQCIEYNSDVKINLVIDSDETRDRRMVKQTEKFYMEGIRQYSKTIYGDVMNGEKIESSRSLLIMGDVQEDAVVTAAGSIFIWGKHQGTAIAGAAGDDKAIIVAGDLDDSVVGIGRFSKQIEIERKSGILAFLNRETVNPTVLKVYNGDIVELPFSSTDVNI